jgi:hypothetical protein
MQDLNKNRIVLIIALLAMVLIAAGSGYRLQVSTSGLIFERNAAKELGFKQA